jgi:hypothetical protein
LVFKIENYKDGDEEEDENSGPKHKPTRRDLRE